MYQAVTLIEEQDPALLVLQPLEAGNEQVVDHSGAYQGNAVLGLFAQEAPPELGCRHYAARLPRAYALLGAQGVR